MMQARSSRNGFTLVEVVLVSFFLVGLTAIVYGTFRCQTQSYRRQTAQNVTQAGLRIWLERMAREVRKACYDPLGTESFRFLIHDASEIQFTYALDSNGDDLVDAAGTSGFRFYDGTLQRWQGTGWRTLVTGLESLSFTYRDVGGEETALPESIAFVEIALSARAETGGVPGLAPPVILQTTAAEVRNDADCQA